MWVVYVVYMRRSVARSDAYADDTAWPHGGMADAGDLKSLARKSVPVRVREGPLGASPPPSSPLPSDVAMKAWQHYAGTIVGLALGCGGAPEAKSARARLPENLVLRVDRVDVVGKRPGTGDGWDGSAPEPRSDAVCSLVAIGTNLISPVAGEGVEGLCGAMIRAEPGERFPGDPDLRLRLKAGASVSFESPVALNVTSHSFSYEFVVPSAAVPADGLRIEVLDDDGKDGGQSLGEARFTLDKLAAIYESPTRTSAVSAGAVLRLEVVVSPYAAMDFDKHRMPATFDPQRIGERGVVAGEIVHLRSEGSYTVGSWYDQPLGPRGYSGGDARRYNFKQEPFVNAPHGAGIALAGQNDLIVGVLVAPCVTFTSLYAGDLRVGINDTEPKNNHGEIAFEGFTRAPTVEEWGRRVNAECR